MHWHYWQLYPFFDRMSLTIPGQIHSFPLLSLPLLSSLLTESKAKGFHWQVRASYLNSSLAVIAAAQGSSCSNLGSSQLFLNTHHYTQSLSGVILPPASLTCILPSSHIKFVFLPWFLSFPWHCRQVGPFVHLVLSVMEALPAAWAFCLRELAGLLKALLHCFVSGFLSSSRT